MLPSFEPPSPECGQFLGIECEYAVHADGTQVDFRSVLPCLADIEGRRESAGRHRLSDGTAITCDGWFAEIASPPEPLTPRTPSRLANQAIATRNWLIDRLDEHSRRTGRLHTLHGHSFHLNAQAAVGPQDHGLVRQHALTFGPLLLYLSSLSSSDGVLYRPRPGRLEIVTDFVADPLLLRATISALIGSLLAVRAESPSLPSLAPASLRAAPIRYGWHLPSSSLGPKLRSQRRSSLIVCADRSVVQLQRLLDELWQAMFAHLERHLHPAEIALTSSFIAGDRTPAFERPPCPAPPLRRAAARGPRALGGEPYRAALAKTRLLDWQIEPAFVHWTFAVFSASANGGKTLVNIPHALLADFGAGHLDTLLAAELDERRRTRDAVSSGTTLDDLRDTMRPGLFDAIDAASLDRQIERTFTKIRKRRKKGTCQVVRVGPEAWDIGIPFTSDPLQILKDKQQEPPQNALLVAHGVFAHSGGVIEHAPDHRVRSIGYDFVFLRHYRSHIQYDGIMGRNWDHGYNIRVVPQRPVNADNIDRGWLEHYPGGTSGDLTYYHGDGRRTEHKWTGWLHRRIRWCSGTFDAIVSNYSQNPGEDFQIQRYAVISGSIPPCVSDPIFYRIRFRGNLRYLLNCHGYLVEIRDRNFNMMCFQYGEPVNPSTNYLVLRTVIDTQRREYALDYFPARDFGGVPRLKSVTDFGGRTVEFTYNTEFELDRVKLVTPDAAKPERPEIVYSYERRAWQGQRTSLLKTIVNPVESASSQEAWLENIRYDNEIRLRRQRMGGTGASPRIGGTYEIEFPSANQVTVKDRAGSTRTHTMRPMSDTKVREKASIEDVVYDGSATPASKTIETVYDYDFNFHLTKVQHPGGRIETFDYRNFIRLLLSGNEEMDSIWPDRFVYENDLGRDDLVRIVDKPAGAGTALASTFEYDDVFNSVSEKTTPVGTTTYIYKHGRCAMPGRNGNPVEIIYPPQDLPDGKDLAVSEEFEYGVGGFRTFYQDADGVHHDYTPHPSGQIAIHTIGGDTEESYQYDEFGRLKDKTDSRGSKWSYQYDRRDNLILAIDPLGHTESYGYDKNDRHVVTTTVIADDPTGIHGFVNQVRRIRTDVSQYDILSQRAGRSEVVVDAGQTPSPPDTRSWKWDYDGEGRVTRQQSPRSVSGQRPDAQVGYQYNKRGLRSEVTEAYGGGDSGTTTTLYDVDDRAAFVSDPFDLQHITEYDGFGRVKQETLPGGVTRHYQYKGAKLEKTWTMGPIDLGPPQTGGKVVIGVLREAEYTTDNALRTIVRTEREFIPEERATLKAGAGGKAQIKTWYTAAGRVEKVIDPSGGITSHVHDFFGRGELKKTTFPDGHTTEYEYDGNLPKIITTRIPVESGTRIDPPPLPLKLTEVKTYDKLGRCIQHTDANGISTSYAHDSVGHVRAASSNLSLQAFEHDGLQRRTRHVIHDVTNPSSPQVMIDLRFAYDLNDNRIRATDGAGRLTASSFDGRDQIISIKQPDEEEIQFARRIDGKVSRVTRINSSIRYEYNQLGFIDRIQYTAGGRGSEQRFGYNGLGQVTWAMDGNAGTDWETVQIYRSHDSLGRVRRERTVIPSISFERTIHYSFGTDFRSKTIRPPEGNPITWEFGPHGSVRRVIDGSAVAVERWYQGHARIIESSYPITLKVTRPQPAQTTFDLRFAQRFDSRGRPAFRTAHISDSLFNPTEYIDITTAERILYSTVHGMMETREMGALARPGVLATPLVSKFGYDAARRMRQTSDQQASSTTTSQYDWDAANRISGFAQSGPSPATIDSRYSGSTRTDTFPKGAIRFQTSWNLDQFGRLTECREEMQNSSGGVLFETRKRELGYDPAGRLANVEMSGFSRSRDEASYLYDGFNRLVARFGKNGRLSAVFLNDGTSCLHEYDSGGKGRPQRRYVRDELGNLVGCRYYDGALQRFVDTIPIVALDGQPWLLFQRGASIDTLPTRPAGKTTADQRRSYYLQNLPLLLEEHRWAPFEKLPPLALQAPTVVQYTYGPGGASSRLVGGSILPIGAGGRRVFAEEGLVSYGGRFYDPEFSAFVSADFAGAWADPNAYGQTRAGFANNPAVFKDDGHWSQILLGVLWIALGGAAIGFGFSVIGQLLLIAEGKKNLEEFSVPEAFWAAASGALLAPVLVFAPELAFPLAAVGLAQTLSAYHENKIGGYSLAFNLAAILLPLGAAGRASGRSLPLRLASFRDAAASAKGTGQFVRALAAGFFDRNMPSAAGGKKYLTLQSGLFVQEFSDALWARALYAVKYAKRARRLYGSDQHHPFPEYLIEAIRTSRHGAGLRPPPEQELVDLSTILHNNDLHPLFDEVFLPLSRRQGAARIASLLNNDATTPAEIAGILERYYRISLSDYPEELDLALYGMRHVRQSMGF